MIKRLPFAAASPVGGARPGSVHPHGDGRRDGCDTVCELGHGARSDPAADSILISRPQDLLIDPIVVELD